MGSLLGLAFLLAGSAGAASPAGAAAGTPAAKAPPANPAAPDTRVPGLRQAMATLPGAWHLFGSQEPGQKVVTLDFLNADIQDVLKALALQSGANILVAPKVEGKVTVGLRSVTPEQALEYIVRLASLAYGREEGTYVVCPRDQIAEIFPPGTRGQIMFPPPGAEAARTAADTPQVALVRSEKLAVADALAVLRKLVPGLQTQTPEPKVIALIGTAAQIQSAQQTLKTLEEALPATLPDPTALQPLRLNQPANLEIETYTLRHVSATDAGRILQGFMNAGVLPKVVITPAPAPTFPQVSRETDGTTTSVTGAYPPLSDPAQALLNMLYGSTLPGKAAVEGAEAAKGMAATPAEMPQNGYPLAPGTTVAIPPDSTTHTLLLIGARTDIARVRGYLDQIDIAPAQVMIDVKVTDISLTDAERLGITWNWSTYGIRELAPTGGGTSSTGAVVPGLQLGRFGHVPISLNATLEAMLSSDRGRLLANPRVAVLDGQTASIHVGDTIRYLEQRTVGVTGTSSVTIGSVNVGVVVDVAPRIGGDNVITMDVRPKVSVITSFTATGDGGQVPNTSERSVDTVVRLRDGETLAIGGLIREEDVTTKVRVPGLGDIPIVGELFKFRSKSRRNSEVLIFITPRIVPDTP